ncbi:MAG: 2-oxo-4-hydroxy-4-carboxy-5-ureidoimidazoline decarboxylase [Alphaproteobacteria bacterium]
MEEVDRLSPADFIARFGALFEHSPWVAEAAERRRPFGSIDAMLVALRDAMDDADEARQLALLRAHPELAGKAAIDATLTRASASEQASAGLDRLTPQEFALFHERNAAYSARFDFPFIICVRLAGGKEGILKAMQTRVEHDRATEFATALDEVFKIARLRLEDALA